MNVLSPLLTKPDAQATQRSVVGDTQSEIVNAADTCTDARVGGCVGGGDDGRHSAGRSTKTEDQELGRGRSGVVFRSLDGSGRQVARKVFGSSGVTKAVQYVFLGSPNPYMWNEPAVRTAVLRRRVLAELVEYWFGSKLRVARAYDHDWNEVYRAFDMRCELVDGRHAALHHAYTSSDDTELEDATGQIMKPLQSRLIESGFDGLVWQAGLGNPVALNNFLCEGSDRRGGYRWAWIDLESGVPALIPMNPLQLFKFYLPKSIRHRGPLFDDVDIGKLRTYVAGRRAELEECLGGERLCQLDTDIESLAQNQQEWKSLARHRCSVGYHHARGSITDEQAAWYAEHPLRWYSREALRAVRSTPRILASCVARVGRLLAKIKVIPILKSCWSGMCSQAYRERLARDYVDTRITRWSARGQLSPRHAAALRTQLQKEETSAYVTDFGVHLAIKPVVKLAQFSLMPALWVAGVVDDVFLASFLIAGGCAVRTLYTLGRCVQNALARREKPWVALGIGTLPVVGNVAFPMQVIFSGAHGERAVAQFILYDTFGRLGQWFPIWGGFDTLTEHVANRIPRVVLPKSATVTTLPTEMVESDPCAERVETAVPEPVSV